MDINLFKFCSGLRVLGYVMILLVAAIIGVSYDAVVLLTCGLQLLRGGFHSFLSFTIVITFHVLLILLLWSYIRVVLNDPGSVPENWRAVSAEENLELVFLWQRRKMDLREDPRMESRRGAIIVLFVEDVFSRWTTTVSGW